MTVNRVEEAVAAEVQAEVAAEGVALAREVQAAVVPAEEAKALAAEARAAAVPAVVVRAAVAAEGVALVAERRVAVVPAEEQMAGTMAGEPREVRAGSTRPTPPAQRSSAACPAPGAGASHTSPAPPHHTICSADLQTRPAHWRRTTWRLQPHWAYLRCLPAKSAAAASCPGSSPPVGTLSPHSHQSLMPAAPTATGRPRPPSPCKSSSRLRCPSDRQCTWPQRSHGQRARTSTAWRPRWA